MPEDIKPDDLPFDFVDIGGGIGPVELSIITDRYGNNYLDIAYGVDLLDIVDPFSLHANVGWVHSQDEAGNRIMPTEEEIRGALTGVDVAGNVGFGIGGEVSAPVLDFGPNGLEFPPIDFVSNLSEGNT